MINREEAESLLKYLGILAGELENQSQQVSSIIGFIQDRMPPLGEPEPEIVWLAEPTKELRLKYLGFDLRVFGEGKHAWMEVMYNHKGGSAAVYKLSEEKAPTFSRLKLKEGHFYKIATSPFVCPELKITKRRWMWRHAVEITEQQFLLGSGVKEVPEA